MKRLALVALLLASACGGTRHTRNDSTVESLTPVLGLGPDDSDPTVQRTPCQLAAAVVVERTKQTTAESGLERHLAKELVAMLDRVIATRCEADVWTSAATSCFASTSLERDPLVDCIEILTDEQRDSLYSQILEEKQHLSRPIEPGQ